MSFLGQSSFYAAGSRLHLRRNREYGINESSTTWILILTSHLIPHPGKYTVPVLWDTKEKTIVNNESSEILRMFNSQVWEAGGGVGHLCDELPC